MNKSSWWPAVVTLLSLGALGGCGDSARENSPLSQDAASPIAAGPSTLTRTENPPQETPSRASGAVGESNGYAVRIADGEFIQIPESDNMFDLNTDLTMEMWVRFPIKRGDGRGQFCLVGNEFSPDMPPSAATTASGWVMRVRPVGIHLEWSLSVATERMGWVATTTRPLSRPDGWCHFAASKRGDQVRVFVDGKLEAYQILRGKLVTSPTAVFLGPPSSESEDRRVLVDMRSLRISTSCRYAADFQPPAAFENDNGTVVRFDFAGGTGQDFAKNDRIAKFFGPTWISGDAPAPEAVVVREEAALKAPRSSRGDPLSIAHGLWVRGANRSEDFQKALRDVRDKLPEIPIATKQQATWTKVKLNSTGAKLDAIRFTSPLDKPADMRCVFAIPARSITARWNIAPLQGSMSGFQNVILEKNLRLAGTDLPARNAVIFQAIDGGQILPHQEYVIWFALPDSNPVDFHVLIKLVPEGTAEPVSTSSEFASALGLPQPFEFTTPPVLSELLAWAKDLAANGDLPQAIEIAERVRSQEPTNRQALFLLARLKQDWAFLRVDVDRHQANDSLFQSARLMRDLRQAHGEFNDAEQAFWSTALYNEACAYAFGGDSKQALTSLREALAAGFAELTTLENDPDLASLREQAEFKTLADELRKKVSAGNR